MNQKINIQNSRIDKIFWRYALEKINFKRDVYIKRDDELDLRFNGNKARKFWNLLKMELDGKSIISYGGNQSNAMLSLSHLANFKNCNFYYFTNKLPKDLRENLEGNIKISLDNGMILKEVAI